jgi:hypothetical protein
MYAVLQELRRRNIWVYNDIVSGQMFWIRTCDKRAIRQVVEELSS